MTTFVDTSAIYAILDADDEFHDRARRSWAELLSNGATLLTTSYVLVETFALVQARLGMDAVRGLSDHLLPAIRTIEVTLDDHDGAVQALLAASRRDLSLVDCTSFLVMRRLGVRSAFTFDA
ncbi:MAG: type II toxin-antitoxin system VapC family toxin, partial [Gemmatimonadota bacterium]